MFGMSTFYGLVGLGFDPHPHCSPASSVREQKLQSRSFTCDLFYKVPGVEM